MTIARLWRRWRFHLSALALVVPIAGASGYLEQMALFEGATALGQRDAGVATAGSWAVRVAEFEVGPPAPEGEAGPVKAFALSLQGAGATEVKAVFLRVGKPRGLRTAGSIGFGDPFRQLVDVRVPETTSPDAALWITFEGWDGSVRETSMLLADASPATVAWLKNKRSE